MNEFRTLAFVSLGLWVGLFQACGGKSRSDSDGGGATSGAGGSVSDGGDGGSASGGGDGEPPSGSGSNNSGDGDGDIGGSAGGTGDGDGETDCVIDGVVYPDGTAVPAIDCNDRWCERGQIVSTLVGCGAGAIDACTADFDPGPCEAAMPVFWFNASTGYCEERSYGGCGGNENRYTTELACLRACGVSDAGMSCKSDGKVYRHGKGNVPHPESCNVCDCDNGELTRCTEAVCPEPCGAGEKLGSTCASCGGGGGCTTMETACLTECETDTESTCDEAMPVCTDGLCGFGACF